MGWNNNGDIFLWYTKTEKSIVIPGDGSLDLNRAFSKGIQCQVLYPITCI